MARTSDEQDSTTALWGNYILTALVLTLLFVTDWYFENDILSETLVGILVGAPIGWIAAMNGYFFPSARNGKNAVASDQSPVASGKSSEQ